MKLSRNIEHALILVAVSIIFVLGAFLIKILPDRTFANSETRPVLSDGMNFVTFYDDGEKLTIKTNAGTVADALEAGGIIINSGDKVEPGLETEINASNFYINIYRARPVILRDGMSEKYVMSASYSPREIFNEAGIMVYDGDEISAVPSRNFLEAGVAITYEIRRNGGRIVTIEEEIPFSEQTEKDYNLAPGAQEVRQLGEVGTKRISYNILYVDGVEVSRELVSEEIVREPVVRVVAVGASKIERNPLTPSKGRNRYTVTLGDGRVIERQETFYDLPMAGVMRFCGGGNYTVRADGAKVDAEGYILIAADLSRYPRCSIVETSLGPGKVYDTGAFVATNPEQFDIATDWTNRDGI